MRKNVVETVMGGVVLIVAALFVIFAYRYTGADIKTTGYYELWGAFDRMDGLQTGDEVTISGIKVGTVLERKLDEETNQAIVRWNVANGVKLSSDTIAEVVAESLLGGKYLALHPGGDDDSLEPGDEIIITQMAYGLVRVIGEAISRMSQRGDE
jgi:phospholipid/cholesterol/gamma-HCH transport system substrate-binding protein